MGDVVLALGEHDVGAVLADDAHIFDPRAGEDRVVGVAGPVDAVARGGMPERHGRRAVAGIAGVPEVIGSVVADQDVAALADLAVPGVAAGAGEDRVLRDRRPGDQWPGGRGLLADRPRETGGQRCRPGSRRAAARPRRVKKSGASTNHLRVPSGCDGRASCAIAVGSGPSTGWPIAPGPWLLHLTLRSAQLGRYFKFV